METGDRLTSTTSRARGILALVLVVGLALAGLSGCFSSSEPDAPASEPNAPGDDGTSPTDRGSGETTSGNGSQVQAPEPPVGRQWTYEAQGAWNDLGRFHVVLALREDGSYLLAGTEPDDLDEEVFDRPWHGPVDGDLNPAEGTTFWDPLFDFPLHDGKTWSWGEDDTVRATAKTLQTPSGPSEGFEMVLEGPEGIDIRWTYAPDVAFLTSFTYELKDTTIMDIELVDVSTAQDWLWFEEGPSASANANPEPTDPPISTLEVPEGYDAVIVSAGVEGGGETTVHPPPSGSTDPWTYEGSQEEQWTYDILPGHEGTWTLQASRDSPPPAAEGYAAVGIRAVEWVDLGG